jgi:hypothetical protein
MFFTISPLALFCVFSATETPKRIVKVYSEREMLSNFADVAMRTPRLRSARADHDWRMKKLLRMKKTCLRRLARTPESPTFGQMSRDRTSPAARQEYHYRGQKITEQIPCPSTSLQKEAAGRSPPPTKN